MRQRIITGLIGAVAVILILLSNSIIFKAAIALISLYALNEMYTAIGIKSNFSVYIAGLIFSAFMLIASFFTNKLTIPILMLYIVTVFGIMLFNFKTVKVSDLAISMFMVLYIVFMMSHISSLRDLNFGNFYIWFIIIGAFGTDTFAYFTGVTIGKHKLCPEISPKKTVEGAVGGIIGVVLCYIVMGIIIEKAFSVSEVNYLFLIALAVICGIFSEIGDLAASMIKRQYNIKDFGTLLPGHGGIMDRLDSIIFISPLVYYYVQYFPVLG